MPVGTVVVAVNPHMKGSWSAGHKVDTEIDGKEIEYFLKVVDPSFDFDGLFQTRY